MVDSEYRDLNELFDLLRVIHEPRAGSVHGGDDSVNVVSVNGCTDMKGASSPLLEQHGKRAGLFHSSSADCFFNGRETYRNGEVRSDILANFFHDLFEETDSVHKVTAVLIGALHRKPSCWQ